MGFFEKLKQGLSKTKTSFDEKINSVFSSFRKVDEEFLEEFGTKREHGLVGFCVLGGIFSEGIDLTEEKLIGAIIVGTGLPQVCNEREILKNYFDSKGENGFSYAYLYPGMNKVEQAAGRVIRTEKDRGVIALLDERFLGKQYQDTFPREWKIYEKCNLMVVKDKVQEFYQKRDEEC